MTSKQISPPILQVEDEEDQEDVDSLMLMDYFEALEEWRRPQRLIERHDATMRRAILNQAQAALEQLERDSSPYPVPLPPMMENVRILYRWLIWQLKHRNGSPELNVKNALGSIQRLEEVGPQSLGPLEEGLRRRASRRPQRRNRHVRLLKHLRQRRGAVRMTVTRTGPGPRASNGARVLDA